MIKAITFDFWQTLYRSQPVDFLERTRRLKGQIEQASQLAFEDAKFDVAVQNARDTWNSAWVDQHRTLNAYEWLSIVLQSLEIALEGEALKPIQLGMEERVLEERPALVEEAHPVLASLASRYRLAIISDTGLTPGRMLRQVMEADDLLQYFSHLTFSDELGNSKPHPRAFLSTLAALDATPAEAVHIGDLLRTDIAGAKQVGMRGVQYIGVKKDAWASNWDFAPENPITPDAIIEHHTELEPLIRRWNTSSL